jgi:hypothetical protein
MSLKMHKSIPAKDTMSLVEDGAGAAKENNSGSKNKNGTIDSNDTHNYTLSSKVHCPRY